MECARRFFPRSPPLIIVDMTLVAFAFAPPGWEDRGGEEYECRNDRGVHNFGGLRGWSRNGDEREAPVFEEKLAALGRPGFEARALEAVEEEEFTKEEGNAETKGEEPSPASPPPERDKSEWDVPPVLVSAANES